MAQRPIEMILTRQLASYLAVPIFLVDPDGALVFYNEPAERILGLRYEETGDMPASEWGTAFVPTDDAGAPVSPDALPLMVALAEGRPAHGGFWIRGRDGARRRIQTTAFPLIGQTGCTVGAVALFWESSA
jgi:PAS domain-containing protein